MENSTALDNRLDNSTAVASINVLLVDDHAMFREGLARVLEREPGISVVGQSGNCADAMALIEKSGANLVLLDVDLGAERALDFVVEAKKRLYNGKILVVTAGVSGPEAVQLVQAGVAGILHKHHSIDALCKTIRQVAAGEVSLEQDYLTALFHSVDRTKETNRPRLTDRDKKVLRYIFQGLTNKEIGGKIEISEGAVKFSLRQLCDKLGVRTRAQLVKVALEEYRDQL
jgi:two-component system nitrate/nitrite response regulator NarL